MAERAHLSHASYKEVDINRFILGRTRWTALIIMLAWKHMSSFSSCQVVMSLNSNYAVLGMLNKLSYQKVEFRSEICFLSWYCKFKNSIHQKILNTKTKLRRYTKPNMKHHSLPLRFYII